MRVFISLAVLLAVVSTSCLGEVLICYYGSWASFRQGVGKLTPDKINPKLCTHLIYAFADVSTNGEITPLDRYTDLPDEGGLDGYGKFVGLKEKSKDLKVMIAIGGAAKHSATFSSVVSDPALRAKFVSGAVEFLQKYKFDGLDVDWQYPAQNGGKPSDKENFSILLKELKAALEPHGLLLTTAVAAAESSARISYDVKEVFKYADYVNLMTYDLHGSWDNTVGINAPLYDKNTTLNVNASVNYWLESGANATKLVLGIPTYGRTFKLANRRYHNPGNLAAGPGKPGRHTASPGTLGYNELCRKNWTYVWDEDQQGPYSFRGTQWVGYDNSKSVGIKTNYAKSKNLGGVMFWSLDTDDFHGCCGYGKYPLIKKARSTLF